jgi:hypothetical protein
LKSSRKTNKDTIMTDQEIIEVAAELSAKSLNLTRVCGFGESHTLMEDAGLIELARALLSRAIPEGHVVVPGWLPIETAPALNGGSTKAVLVWCPSNLCMFTAHFDQDFEVWKYFAGNGGVMFVEPTHWMPLPAAPANKEEA